MSVPHTHPNAANRKPRRKPQRKAEPVTVTRVDPQVMAQALDMANGDASRLRVIDANTVIVKN
jgi:hypothetical protein